jgi:HEAT repeat protein
MGARPRAELDPEEVAGLGKLLLMGRTPSLREWAAGALAECGMVSAYAYLRHALWDPVESVQRSAVRAVASLSVRQCAGELAALYAWSGPRLRREILRAVRRIGSGSGFDAVLRLAQDDPDSRVRLLALRERRAVVPLRRRS